MNLKSDLAGKLKDVLENMSQDEFDKEWSEITSLNLESPSFDEAIEYFALMQGQLGKFEMANTTSDIIPDSSDFTLAA